MFVSLNVWNQFGGNRAGSGYRLVNTTSASAPGWAANLPGPTGTSSPVLGPDGTIYIGTTNGRLVALHPDYQAAGQIKWATQVLVSPVPYYETYAVQTPAVADDGTIYCLCTPQAIIRDHRHPVGVRGLPSYLASVSPEGAIRWTLLLPFLEDSFGQVEGVVNGAPRLLSPPQSAGGSGFETTSGRSAARRLSGRGASGPPLDNPVYERTRIIFIVRYTLVVPDPNLGPEGHTQQYVSRLMFAGESTIAKTPHGPEPEPQLRWVDYEVQNAFIDAHGSGGTGSAFLTEPSGPPDLPAKASPCGDTPVVFGSLPATEPWTIIASGNEGLYKVGWDSEAPPPGADEWGRLTGDPTLFPLQASVPALTAAFANGLAAGVTHLGATFIDPDTFTQYLQDTSLLAPATVAGGGRQMYFVNRFGQLYAVEPNGSVWKERNLHRGSVAFPALSGNHVHVATTAGLQTLTLDLQDVAFFPLDGAGFSSPAIGPDGAVYVAAGAFLYAFSDALPPIGGGFRNL
jgi:outer membrane protein assembly factor BamB